MKLLAALDLSTTTPAVLREARNWARRLSAQLTLLHVAAPDPDFIGYEPGPATVRASVARQFHREHQQLDAAAQELRKEGIDTTALLVQGPTAETILAEADKLSADAIFMGTRAHGVVHDLIVGSVSRQVLGKSTRPVLLVPPRDRD